MNAWIGWARAVLAVAAGYAGWGWRGLMLALTVIVFWLLLQFSRAMRVLRAAGSRPVGSVASAVMLHSRLGVGLQMMQVVKLAGSLGERADAATAAADTEAWRWRDAGGDAVRVTLRGGRVVSWELERSSPGAPPDARGAAGGS